MARRPGSAALNILFVLVFVLVLASPARAADPRFVWETIETPHFQVHHHQHEQALAQRVARMAELAHRKLQPLLDHEPSERCHIVLTDDTDSANGSATPLLVNTIRLNAPPPDARSTLSDFDDYVWELVSHEYTHILHLDTVIGLPAAWNAVFGKLWIPNGAQPRWFTEGLAVFQESAQSASGRERASQEEMAVRSQILEGTFPTIWQLSNVPLQWPRGDSWYTIGGRFLAFIADKYGAGALRDLSHDYGGRPIPFGLNLSARTVTGKTYLELYDEFEREERERAQEVVAQVREQGETTFEVLTALGETTRSPRFSRDGSALYYSSAGADRLPEIRERRGASDRRLSDAFGDPTLSVAPDGRIVYSRIQIYQRFEDLDDLYSLDPKTGDSARVTRGLRASEPDVAPDGTIVFVWRRPGGHTAIAELLPGASEPRVLFQDAALEPVGSPRVSPDGRLVAFVHHRDASWDVRIVSRADLSLTDVTHDRSLERDPCWTPDGKTVVFSSDRSGIFDLYAFEIATGALQRITRVTTGAFEPSVSPDGKQLAFVTYSARGFDIARMPLDSGKLTKPPRPVALDRPRPAEEPPRELFPSHPYDPFDTLRPYYWAPFAADDQMGATVGALTSGGDIAGRQDYAAAAWWSIDGRQPGWSARYTSHAQYPDITITASRDLVDVAGVGCGIDGTCTAQRDLSFGAVASFLFPTVERSWSLSLGYDLDVLSNNYLAPGADVPREGTLASAFATLSYSDARRFVRSISTEQGTRASLSVRIADPNLGSTFRYRLATSAITQYVPMPFRHHVLAVRIAGGIGLSDVAPGTAIFTLGGFGITDTIRTLVNLEPAPVRILRGFRRSSFAGDAYALGSAEYRFPIVDVEVGAWTLPLYLRRLHGAAFVDAGDAFDWRNPRPSRRFTVHAGAGAELRAEAILGYVLPVDVRLGCARGLESGPRAILDCYAALGSIF